MKALRSAVVSAALLAFAAGSAALAQGEDNAAPASHRFEEVAPGVYFATGTGQVVNTVSNAMVVVNEDDVLVVDSHITADAAEELIASIRTLTDKPIEFLVNSHFHFDHAHGNQAFPEGVQIIGHDYTRERLLGPVLEEPTYQVMGGPETQQANLDALLAQIEEAEEDDRAALEVRAAVLARHIAALGEVTPTPPNTTFNDHMTLHRGDREIQLIHLGRGHTGGDVVVFLPAERVVFTGDLLYIAAPYLGDAYANEFPDTLERLKALDFDVIVPGHGPLVRDRAVIDTAQAYLRDYWSQVEASHQAGLSVEEAVAALDLSAHAPFGGRPGREAAATVEVARMYELMAAAEE